MIAPQMTLAGLGYLFLAWLAFCIPVVIVFLLQERHRAKQHREFYGRADPFVYWQPNRAEKFTERAGADRAARGRGQGDAGMAQQAPGDSGEGADERARAAGL